MITSDEEKRDLIRHRCRAAMAAAYFVGLANQPEETRLDWFDAAINSVVAEAAFERARGRVRSIVQQFDREEIAEEQALVMIGDQLCGMEYGDLVVALAFALMSPADG